MISIYIRSAVYAATVTLSIVVAQLELASSGLSAYAAILSIGFLILYIELYTSWDYRVKTRRSQLLLQSQEYDPLAHYYYHIILPAMLYLGISGYLYFHPVPEVRIAVVLLATFAYTLLFSHIRAVYTHQTKLYTQTYIAYDIIKILIFYTVLDSSQHFFTTIGVNYLALGIVVTVLTIASWGLIAIRKKSWSFYSLGIFTIILAFLLATSFAAILAFPAVSLIPFLITFVYYLATSTLLHLLDNSLKIQTILEYLFLIILAFVLLYGLA